MKIIYGHDKRENRKLDSLNDRVVFPKSNKSTYHGRDRGGERRRR